MKQWLTGLFAILLILSFPVSGFSYSNPQIVPDSWQWNNGNFYGEGDPYILKFNGVYYLYTSTVDDKPGVKVWSSEDLVNWEYRGLAAEEPVTKGAYAPEVVYWNGDFYMYTALLRDDPSTTQRGHRVLKSSSPTGPFTAQTGNMVNGIDGHVFIDDDGKWYFYSTGNGNIDVRPMSDPYTFGEKTNTGAAMKGWTEGPTVIKRNGKYYMTYTGNHIWSDAYRVDYASSSNPVTGFVPAVSQNPILLDAEGDHVGLGHNSIVRGPDLDSDYIVYHSHANPGRHLNLDRILWNGDKMLVLGPTTSEQPDPAMPDFSDRFQRNALGGEWKAVGGGNWGIRDGSTLYQDAPGEPEQSHMLLSRKATEDSFTAEFNLKQSAQGDSGNPLIGAVFSYTNENNYGAAVLSRNHNRLETYFRIDGKETERIFTPLPEGYDYTKWHQIRVEKEGSDYRIYVDGMLKQTRSVEQLGKGKIGYMTQDTQADFGYVAFSNKVGGNSGDSVYKPIPGDIEAVHFNRKGNSGSERGNQQTSFAEAPDGSYYLTSFQQGNVQYNVNVSEAGTYDVLIRYAAADDARLKLELDDSKELTDIVQLLSTGSSAQWDNVLIQDIELPKGLHQLKVVALGGASFEFSSIKFNRSEETTPVSDDFNDGDDLGWTKFEQGWRVDTGSAPSFDQPKPVPGIVEAPYYNTGGEGVAYHDNTPDNIGGAYRGDSVDIRTNTNFNGLNVGWNQAGEWLKYNIDVKHAGIYRVEVTAATTFSDNQARVWLNGTTDLTGAMNIPATGAWNNWQTTLSPGFYLPEGQHTITFETVKGEYDFARLEFVSFDTPKPVPGIIEAVHYNSGGEGIGYHDNAPANLGGQYRDDGVDIRVNPKGGWNVGWNQTGEWLKYNVNVADSAVYELSVRLATALNGGKIRLWLNDTTDLTGVVDIPATGGWNSWKNVKLGDITLPEGNHTLKLEIVQGEYDLESLSFHPLNNAQTIPGTVHAVDYMIGGEGVAYHDNTPDNIRGLYRTDDVDIRLLPEGFTTGWNQTGEWLKYSVNVTENTSRLDMRVATGLNGAQVRLWLDDTTDLTGIINVPNTGGFHEWMNLTKEGVFLPAGQHTIKVEVVTGEFDFYSFRFHNDPIVPIQGVYKSQPKGYPKSVIGDSDWSDYIVETDIKLGSNTQGGGNAGILLRVNNPADGTEYGQNRDDFFQGYLAYLTADGVHLGKFNYNFQHLTGTAFTGAVGSWQHMKVVAAGSRIKVYVGDMEKPLIDFTDRSEKAFIHGKVGVRSFNGESFIDNFTVMPIIK
ncbi:carbohydrate-binding protein [Paenibacillus sp. N4]|uniref:carbohydrate-binding protein n=1 Tax=Paenibacillus vietnamensis TaxID=2590547 RepID=UPI001CD10A0D|nr:carbohydrate-binding protein [Paenibacillus vietnamensis]MCA0757887.1 carbohydrate-binding protein [Paenibacillus vietnamensis]